MAGNLAGVVHVSLQTGRLLRQAPELRSEPRSKGTTEMSPARSLLRTARQLWSAVIRGNPAGAPDRIPGVIVHDPDAQKAKDLDDPFLDAKAHNVWPS